MHPIVEARRAEIEELCRRHHVKRLDVFGSAASGNFNLETSDIDFLVEFNTLEPVPYKRAFFALLKALELVFGRKIDLVTAAMLQNPHLARSVESMKVPLYDR